PDPHSVPHLVPGMRSQQNHIVTRVRQRAALALKNAKVEGRVHRSHVNSLSTQAISRWQPSQSELVLAVPSLAPIFPGGAAPHAAHFCGRATAAADDTPASAP